VHAIGQPASRNNNLVSASLQVTIGQRLNSRFEQYKDYEQIFGFLFTSDWLRSLDDISLKDACLKLEAALKYKKHKVIDGEELLETHRDIDGADLWVELIFIQDMLEKSMGPLDILKFLEKRPYLAVANIAYSILLTIPVTVASAKRSFSKLKLLKSYMCSTMTQERLSGLTTIALESEILEKINYNDMIEDFILRNTRRMLLFGRS
jgi:hypothetical protein